MSSHNVEKDFRKLAYYFMSVMDGDTHHVSAAMDLLTDYGLIDEAGEYQYDDELDDFIYEQTEIEEDEEPDEAFEDEDNMPFESVKNYRE